MERKVTFDKQVDFPTMIGEISAISLEPNLSFVDESSVEGNLILQGKYKMTEASRLEEDFEYQIPIEIAFTEKLDLNTAKIEVTDFTYEIENEDMMICHIELLIEGEEMVEELEEDRECDDNPLEKEIEIPTLEGANLDNNREDKENNLLKDDYTKKDKIDDQKINEEVLKNDFVEGNEIIKKDTIFNFSDEEESYGTFLVYIVRQNETINSIIEKYNTTLEDVEQYNDISNIEIGKKLIIPLKHE